MTQGRKDDAAKPRADLLPPDALLAVAEVMTGGAAKYGDRNWEQGMAWGRLVGAALRHLLAWMGGQNRDPDTGLSHLAHTATSLLFLLAYEIRGVGVDDRATPGGPGHVPHA